MTAAPDDPGTNGARLPSRAVRLAVAGALLLLAGLFGAGEWRASRDRSLAAGAEQVDADVAPAREHLARRLLDFEASCATLAEEAFRRAGETTDRVALFETLAAVPLPPDTGLHVEDRHGRVLAWSGSPLDDAQVRTVRSSGDGTLLLETPQSRRLAVRRTRTSPVEGVPVLAVCHRPVEVRSPLRNRFFAPWSLETEVEEEFRVGAARILPASAEEGEAVPSAFGGPFARLDVRPLSARSWEETVDAAAASRRAAIAAAAIFVLAIGLLLAPPAGAGRARAALFRAATIVAARAALGLLPSGTFLPAGPLTDATRFAHHLPLSLADSPLDLVLTSLAAFGAAHWLRRAAQAAAWRVATAVPAALGVAAACVAVRLALSGVVADVVRNSTIEFLPQDSVLPREASAALLLSLLGAGAAAVLLVDAVRLVLRPRDPPRRGTLLAAALSAALLAAPLGLDGAAEPALLTLVAWVGIAAAFASLFAETGVATRAAVIPLGVAAALFAPLEGGLARSLREAVADEAEQRVTSSGATARLVVERTLDGLVLSEELSAALAAGSLPRDLTERLWSESPLATQPGGSSIEVVPLASEVEPRRFGVNLPPVHWLPLPTAAPSDGTVSAPLPGRGPGRDGRWLVGERRVAAEGRVLAIVRVVLEARAPANPGLPELQVLGPRSGSDAREAPPLAVALYAPDRRMLETNDPWRAAGSPLAGDLAEEAVGAGGHAWRRVRRADRDLAVLVRAETRNGAVLAYHAFSFDTGGPRRLLLRLARTALCGALVAAVALAFTVRRWARGARARLAQRLVLSYVVVSGVPLLALGWANRELSRTRSEDAAQRELQQAVALLGAELQRDEDLVPGFREMRADLREERLRAIAFGLGHHANVFLDAALVASSDQALFDTELVPRRLPGGVYREVILLGRPFLATTAAVGGAVFDVGYAPVRTGDGEVVGALSVPLLQQRRLRDRELADTVTAIFALYLAGLAAAGGVGVWLARRLSEPLRDLEEATRRVAAGDLSRPVPEAGPGEVREVAGAFNRMQRDLAESREKLVRAEKEAAWRDMARQVAHEVKNPLTPMRLAAEHVRRAWRDRVPNFEEILDRGVDVIVRQTESLQRIATAFSDFARLPGRRREPVDLAAVARSVLDLYANTPRLAVRAEIADGLPPVTADPDEMRRVLVNLAKNAVEAVEGRGGTMTLRLRRDGDALVLEVSDDGPGIPDDVRPRLFEPYFSTKTSGTGLGLAICKRAVEDLGGTIDVASAAGTGTTVTVRLPVS